MLVAKVEDPSRGIFPKKNIKNILEKYSQKGKNGCYGCVVMDTQDTQIWDHLFSFYAKFS